MGTVGVQPAGLGEQFSRTSVLDDVSSCLLGAVDQLEVGSGLSCGPCPSWGRRRWWPLFSKLQVPKACGPQSPHAGQGEDTSFPPFPYSPSSSNSSISVNSGYFEL